MTDEQAAILEAIEQARTDLAAANTSESGQPDGSTHMIRTEDHAARRRLREAVIGHIRTYAQQPDVHVINATRPWWGTDPDDEYGLELRRHLDELST